MVQAKRGPSRHYTRESQIKKKGSPGGSRGKSTAKDDSWMKKLEGKVGPALFVLIMIGVFGGAAIGQMKCKKGFRNA